MKLAIISTITLIGITISAHYLQQESFNDGYIRGLRCAGLAFQYKDLSSDEFSVKLKDCPGSDAMEDLK